MAQNNEEAHGERKRKTLATKEDRKEEDEPVRAPKDEEAPKAKKGLLGRVGSGLYGIATKGKVAALTGGLIGLVTAGPPGLLVGALGGLVLSKALLPAGRKAYGWVANKFSGKKREGEETELLQEQEAALEAPETSPETPDLGAAVASENDVSKRESHRSDLAPENNDWIQEAKSEARSVNVSEKSGSYVEREAQRSASTNSAGLKR